MQKQFRLALDLARAADKNGASVSPLSEEQAHNSLLVLLDNGRAGFAIEPDGNLCGVFKHPDCEIPNILGALVPMAIKLGAKKLDCFDGFLPAQYAKYGFKEVERLAFADEYAPVGWNYETHGRPDVVFMELPQVDIEV